MTSSDVGVYIVDEIVDEIVLVPNKKRKQFSICRSSSSLLNLEIAKSVFICALSAAANF